MSPLEIEPAALPACSSVPQPTPPPAACPPVTHKTTRKMKLIFRTIDGILLRTYANKVL